MTMEILTHMKITTFGEVHLRTSLVIKFKKLSITNRSFQIENLNDDIRMHHEVTMNYS